MSISLVKPISSQKPIAKLKGASAHPSRPKSQRVWWLWSTASSALRFGQKAGRHGVRQQDGRACQLYGQFQLRGAGDTTEFLTRLNWRWMHVRHFVGTKNHLWTASGYGLTCGTPALAPFTNLCVRMCKVCIVKIFCICESPIGLLLRIAACYWNIWRPRRHWLCVEWQILSKPWFDLYFYRLVSRNNFVSLHWSLWCAAH